MYYCATAPPGGFLAGAEVFSTTLRHITPRITQHMWGTFVPICLPNFVIWWHGPWRTHGMVHAQTNQNKR